MGLFLYIMPKSPPIPCNHPGCFKLVSKGYCEQHKPKRKSASKRGYDRQWRNKRLIYLQEHPLCTECESEGKITAATVVDHIIPHRGNKQLFDDDNNLQALCKSCHDRKTRRGE